MLSTDILKERLTIQIPPEKPYFLSKKEKIENINSFCDLSRENLAFGKTERRILLYTTQNGEKIYYQYPGKESTRRDRANFPLDARPVLEKNNSKQSPDMDFNAIWDIIDYLGTENRGNADVLGAIFLRIAYMYQYKHITKDFIYQDIDISSGTIINSGKIKMDWNCFALDQEIIEALNDRFKLRDSLGFSFEAFLYYNDVLAQNEDNKYYLRSNKSEEQILQKGNGRINNCLSHLTVISHIRGNIGISKLISSFRRGVAPLSQSRFVEACGKLVIRE